MRVESVRSEYKFQHPGEIIVIAFKRISSVTMMNDLSNVYFLSILEAFKEWVSVDTFRVRRQVKLSYESFDANAVCWLHVSS